MKKINGLLAIVATVFMCVPSSVHAGGIPAPDFSEAIDAAKDNESVPGFIKRNNPKFWEFSLDPNEAAAEPELYYVNTHYDDASTYGSETHAFHRYLVVFNSNIPPFAQTNLQRLMRGKYGFYRMVWSIMAKDETEDLLVKIVDIDPTGEYIRPKIDDKDIMGYKVSPDYCGISLGESLTGKKRQSNMKT